MAKNTKQTSKRVASKASKVLRVVTVRHQSLLQVVLYLRQRRSKEKTRQ